ncbi:hypothetical protein HED51_16435 [Ochrobactrum grignonense]|nr:hypothetical protein [Brucella grignonensis]
MSPGGQESALSGLFHFCSPEVSDMNMVFPVADPVTPLAVAPAILAAASLLLPISNAASASMP